jgi:hypothetical protein
MARRNFRPRCPACSSSDIQTTYRHEAVTARTCRQCAHAFHVVSAFGERVMTLLDDIWALYNLRHMASLDRVDWTDHERIEILLAKSLSTWDFDELTQLVVRAHDACIRLSIEPMNFRQLRLVFHARAGRDGDRYNRHPTIENAVVRVRTRNYFGPTPIGPLPAPDVMALPTEPELSAVPE